METKMNEKNGTEKIIFWMLKALLCSYVITGISLLILAGVLYKFNLNESKVTAGILIIYVLSSTSGTLITKVSFSVTLIAFWLSPIVDFHCMSGSHCQLQNTPAFCP